MIKIIIRTSTNCNCLFLNLKNAIAAIKADKKKNTGTNFDNRVNSENKSKAKTSLLEFFQSLNTKGSIAERTITIVR